MVCACVFAFVYAILILHDVCICFICAVTLGYADRMQFIYVYVFSKFEGFPISFQSFPSAAAGFV